MPYTPLSSSQHSKLRLTRGTFFHLQDKPMVPVSIVEAQRAGLDLPLAFLRTDKGLSLVAMLSMSKEDNAQVGPKGLWMGGYMPAVVRAYPFALAFQADQRRNFIQEKAASLFTILQASGLESVQNRCQDSGMKKTQHSQFVRFERRLAMEGE